MRIIKVPTSQGYWGIKELTHVNCLGWVPTHCKYPSINYCYYKVNSLTEELWYEALCCAPHMWHLSLASRQSLDQVRSLRVGGWVCLMSLHAPCGTTFIELCLNDSLTWKDVMDETCVWETEEMHQNICSPRIFALYSYAVKDELSRPASSTPCTWKVWS